METGSTRDANGLHRGTGDVRTMQRDYPNSWRDLSPQPTPSLSQELLAWLSVSLGQILLGYEAAITQIPVPKATIFQLFQFQFLFRTIHIPLILYITIYISISYIIYKEHLYAHFSNWNWNNWNWNATLIFTLAIK